MAENVEVIKGASLWRDAWKRLLRNKLAVFGMAVLAFMIVAVIIGPAIIKWATGYTYDSIPTDNDLVKALTTRAATSLRECCRAVESR
jgi:oligopeptide transport system permease protein